MLIFGENFFMIPNILLPRYFKWIGLFFAIAGYGYALTYPYDVNDVAHPAGLYIQVAALVGLLLIAGARERMEDEMIRHIRLTSLQWSVFVLIGLRLLYKSVAFCTQDINWLPKWQVNSLLLFYLVLFYYQLYIRDIVLRFKSTAIEKHD